MMPKLKQATVAAPTTERPSGEADLIAAAQNGDEEATRMLVRMLNRRLFRVARGIVNSDAEAEDVVQETYLKGFTNLQHFRSESSFSTWMTRIYQRAGNQNQALPSQAAPAQRHGDTAHWQHV